jgi:hypothetical protein
MGPPPWNRVAVVFHQVQGLNAAERDVAIRVGCEGSPDLEAEVRRLVRAGGKAGGGGFIREIVARAAAEVEAGRP